jgi:hypothetical protein
MGLPEVSRTVSGVPSTHVDASVVLPIEIGLTCKVPSGVAWTLKHALDEVQSPSPKVKLRSWGVALDHVAGSPRRNDSPV